MKSLISMIVVFRPNYLVTRLSSSISGANGCIKTTNFNSFTTRTHTCGELRKSDAGRKVKLCGWIQFQRLNKFVVLRDTYGVTQLVPDEQRPDIVDKISKAPLESVVSVEGLVTLRPPGQENRKQATGEIEVTLEAFEVLSKCTPNLPFTVLTAPKVNEPLRLEYRYLNLRHETLQKNLRLRSNVVMKMREYLIGHGFVDIETPTLFRKTPGGAQEFVVPTRSPGKFYSLVQSPQQFKQLLMVGGFDRYFQIARCYRDEGTKPDRQPEFTQVDIEMSFTTKEHIQRLIEGLLTYSWPPASSGSLLAPFPEMSYKEAMEKYGVDKPDTSFDNLLLDITTFVKERSDFASLFNSTGLSDFSAIAIVFNNSGTLLSKSADGALIKMTKEKYPQLSFAAIRIESAGKWRSSLAKKVAESTMQNFNKQLGASEGDLILLGLGPRESLVPCMGKMRLEVANLLEKQGMKLRKDGHHFLWVVDFPLFLPGEEDTHRIESAHHPFTAPHPEDAHLLATFPLQVRGLHYDLVLNGSEVGGGSIRIHQADMQEYVLREILKENPTDLQHLLKALECGAPPHGGIALGLDRLMTILCDGDSIRDVIAFPKSLDGKDLMSGSPSFISPKDKEMYHIKTVDKVSSEK